jgi:20S proteasome subunit beta 5
LRGEASDSSDKLSAFKKGTTTLAFKFAGGIIVACDARGSMGSFVGKKNCLVILIFNTE